MGTLAPVCQNKGSTCPPLPSSVHLHIGSTSDADDAHLSSSQMDNSPPSPFHNTARRLTVYFNLDHITQASARMIKILALTKHVCTKEMDMVSTARCAFTVTTLRCRRCGRGWLPSPTTHPSNPKRSRRAFLPTPHRPVAIRGKSAH